MILASDHSSPPDSFSSSFDGTSRSLLRALRNRLTLAPYNRCQATSVTGWAIHREMPSGRYLLSGLHTEANRLDAIPIAASTGGSVQ